MTALYSYVVKTAQQIRDDFLRVVSNGLIAQAKAQGITNFTPNTGPGSDYYLEATALGNEIAAVQANATIQADANMPDTATGANLDRWLAVFGLSRSAGTGAYGNFTPTYSASSTIIPTGAQLTDSAGNRYQVTVGGTYGPSSQTTYPTQVPIQGIDVGSATNHVNGTVLRWTTAPPFTQPTGVVGTPGGTDGLVGGIDSEVGNDEPPRQRLLSLLQNAPRAGNWSNIVLWAVQSSPYVQSCAVYPATQGPSTVQFAVWRAPQTVGPFSSTSKNRDISSVIVANIVVPYVQGYLPEHVYSAGLSVANQTNDVAIKLSLPSATTASPAGPGGGWLDGSPWPQSISGSTPVTVTSVTSSTVITVNATTAPTAGLSNIAWISPSTWQLYTAQVQSFTGSSGAYVLTLTSPFPGIANGNHIFPQAVQQPNYLAAALQAFANLGPGEWLAAATPAITRGFRRPLTSAAWPYSMDANFLRVMENAGPEVLSAQFLYTQALTPTVPANLSTAVNCLVPKNISWYQQ